MVGKTFISAIVFFSPPLLFFLPENALADDYAQRAQLADDPDSELPEDLTAINIEKLLSFNLVVTSASKKEQRVKDVTSAIFVITQEDIRRSGATHVAELLRMVPGIDVARISSNQWAISSRGFNSRFANKLLVQIDGRSIFSLLTNGVYWDTNEVFLEDVERIEVIRGPGSAIWGDNAVNGIINIITKHSKDTQGNLITAGGGVGERGFGSIRHGGTLGDESDTTYRAYGKYSNRGDNRLETGGSANDAWEVASYGYRSDTHLSENDDLSLKVDGFYQEYSEEILTPSGSPPYVDSESFSGNRFWNGLSLTSNYTHKISDQEHLSSSFSFSSDSANLPYLDLSQQYLAVGAEHRYNIFEGHDLIYGGGYRYYQSRTNGSFANDFDPANGYSNLFSFLLMMKSKLLRTSCILSLELKLNTQTPPGLNSCRPAALYGCTARHHPHGLLSQRRSRIHI